jgi:RNA polymerase sigma-70 factor (ECF subfamily)
MVEDVMQEAYIKAYRNLYTFERRSSFSTWVTRILINECMMKKRHSKKEAEIYSTGNEAPERSDNFTPEQKVLNGELKQLLEDAIATLPEKYRTVFVMREIETMSIAETVDVLGIGEANVKTRLSRAKEMLRTQLMSSYSLPQLFEFNLVKCDRIVKNVFAAI